MAYKQHNNQTSTLVAQFSGNTISYSKIFVFFYEFNTNSYFAAYYTVQYIARTTAWNKFFCLL